MMLLTRHVSFRHLAARLFSTSVTTRSSPQMQTIGDIQGNLMKLIGFDRVWGNTPVDKRPLMSKVQSDQSRLLKQRMNDSYAEALVPLGSQPSLRNMYVNPLGSVRFGRLLENLDTMAVHIAYLHNQSQSVAVNGQAISPIAIVTALVDRIEVANRHIFVDKDIKLSGFTSWVGKTSCEVSMKMEQESVSGVWEPLVDAKFLMCARDTENKGPAVMNPLEIINDQERTIFQLGEHSKSVRQKEEQASLFKVPPSNAENLLIHDMFLKTVDFNSGSLKPRVKPENTVWMNETILKNILICFPEYRNLYNKIFGGFIMRQAYELAWANAELFGKARPRLCAVDNISFRRPVLIGSLLMFSSQVVYVERNMMLIRVHAQAIDPVKESKEMTNDFYFKFSVDPKMTALRNILPQSYSEAMIYIDGQRHF